jgi:cobalt-zinc-cadmium efflux system outer membrane protein
MTARHLSLTLSVLLVSTSFAATDLTPELAVALALEKNASLAIASARVVAAEGLRTQAGLKPNPRLILQSENARLAGASPFRYSQDTDNFGYLAQVFEAGGKRQSRIEVASQNVRSNELLLESQRARLAGRVLTAYWIAAGAQRLAAVFADSVSVLERTVQYHRDRVREGSLPEADLIRVQLEQQQVSIDYRNAEQDARRSVLLLFREMGIPEQTDVRLAGDIASVEPVPALDIDEAVERRPDVRLSVQSLKQAQAALRLQRANAVPDPEVLFGYKRTSGFNTVIAGLQLNLPVRNRNQGAIGAAAADETAAAAELRGARTAARTEIVALQGQYEQKRQLVEQTLPSMRAQAAETSRIAEAVYREGASDLLRLLDAERIRIQAESLYIRSLIDYRQAAIGLRTALGILP